MSQASTRSKICIDRFVNLSSKFVFKNPNIKDACGCGESFKVES